MNTTNSLLPPEVVTLVHHVELNRVGWWKKVLSRLALAAVWLETEAQTIEQIRTGLNVFGVKVSTRELVPILASLEQENLLVRIQEGRYRIPAQARSLIDKEIAESERVEQDARQVFLSLAQEFCPTVDSAELWTKFESAVLIPLVRSVGASIYQFIVGDHLDSDGIDDDQFIEQFGHESKGALKTLISSFLDPRNATVRSYVTRLLHAQFCVDSSGLSDDVLKKLVAATGKQPKFRLFVDTNFLFSLLGVHENPSNESAQELRDLLATLNNDLQVDLYIVPRTIDEAKRAIGTAKVQVSGIPDSNNFTEAALRAGVSGMSERFFVERQQRSGQLSADEWFDPYLRDFVPLARAAGVELYNESLDEYATRQDVVDDILGFLNYEKNKLPEYRRKTYDKVAHDMILWHMVKDKRPALAESPVDVQDWVLTVDFRLIGFDQFKMNTSGSAVPLCLHPATLVQLLQFWVPRTQEFEEAILGGLRLPFLFQEFDAEAERLSLTIMRRLGRFQGSAEIPTETLLNVVMNDGLRSRIDEGKPETEEIQMVRDALVEEMQKQAATAKEEIDELTTVAREASVTLENTRKEVTSKEIEIERLQERLDEKESQKRIADVKYSQLVDSQSLLESRLAAIEEQELHRKALAKYVLLLTFVIGFSIVVGWLASGVLVSLGSVFGAITVFVSATLIVFLMTHFALEFTVRQDQRIMNLWPFRQTQRLRKWLWVAVVALVIGVIGSIIADKL